MPRLSVFAVRAALVALLAAAALGSLPLLGITGAPGGSALHAELALVGWLVQLTMGVAYWILPRSEGAPSRRGREGLAVAAVALLQAGVALAVLGLVLGAPGLVASGRALEAVAVASFAAHALPRLRALPGRLTRS